MSSALFRFDTFCEPVLGKWPVPDITADGVEPTMKVFAFCFGMLLVIIGVIFMVTAYTLYERGTAGAGSMFLFGLAVFVGGKVINHATAMTRFLKCVRFGTRSHQVSFR